MGKVVIDIHSAERTTSMLDLQALLDLLSGAYCQRFPRTFKKGSSSQDCADSCKVMLCLCKASIPAHYQAIWMRIMVEAM